MENEQNMQINRNTLDMENDTNAIRIVLDTSVLYAHLSKEDTNHVSVESALGALKPYNPYLMIPSIVLLEVMSKLRRQKYTVANATKLLKSSLTTFRPMYENRQISKDMILDRYKEYSRASLGTLKGPDFYIVVEAITLDAILLTCDVEMKKKAKSTHNKTFLLGEGKKSELPKLIKEIQKHN